MGEIPQEIANNYVIVSPVRDEEQYIVETIRSVTGQTIPPAEWVIVDDGSSDATGKIIDDYARQYPWIKALHRLDRGERVPGTGVMEAFYTGYKSLHATDWAFIVKLMVMWALIPIILNGALSVSMQTRSWACAEA